MTFPAAILTFGLRLQFAQLAPSIFNTQVAGPDGVATSLAFALVLAEGYECDCVLNHLCTLFAILPSIIA